MDQVLARVIRLTTKQQLANPVNVFDACLICQSGR